MVSARSQKGADVLSNPVTRNLAWWEAGRISAPCPGKADFLLPQKFGWGKDPLLPVSSWATAPPVTQNRVLSRRGNRHCHEQQHQERLQGLSFICKELNALWTSLRNYFLFSGLEVEGVEWGVSNITPCAAFLSMIHKDTLPQQSSGFRILSSSQRGMPEALTVFPDPQVTAAFPSHSLLLLRMPNCMDLSPFPLSGCRWKVSCH